MSHSNTVILSYMFPILIGIQTSINFLKVHFKKIQKKVIFFDSLTISESLDWTHFLTVTTETQKEEMQCKIGVRSLEQDLPMHLFSSQQIF